MIPSRAISRSILSAPTTPEIYQASEIKIPTTTPSQRVNILLTFLIINNKIAINTAKTTYIFIVILGINEDRLIKVSLFIIAKNHYF